MCTLFIRTGDQLKCEGKLDHYIRSKDTSGIDTDVGLPSDEEDVDGNDYQPLLKKMRTASQSSSSSQKSSQSQNNDLLEEDEDEMENEDDDEDISSNGNKGGWRKENDNSGQLVFSSTYVTIHLT